MRLTGKRYRVRVVLWGVLAVFGFCRETRADPVLDSGTPDESTNYSIFADSALGAAQFLAQEFSLATAAHVSRIEVYLGATSPGAAVTIDLARSIRAGTTAGDILSTAVVTAPLATPSAGRWVGATVDVDLAPGTYYLVFSSGTPGAYAPLRAPNDIGGRLYTASDSSFPFSNVNTALAAASNFSQLGDPRGTGVRLIPEPPFLLLAAAALAGLRARRARRVGAERTG